MLNSDYNHVCVVITCLCVLQFLIAVHCDITVWYMTLVMGLNRSIYPFTPERPRDLSMRPPEPAPSGVYILDRAPDLCLFENFARTKCQLRVYPLRYQKSKSFVCFFSLRVGELSGFFNPH